MTSCCPQNSGVPAGARFDTMIENCYAYADKARQAGRPIVGILCEYTPRELILAAGGVPVCLCGGSQAMIAPAEQELPAGLCPLIKSTYGYCLSRSNPFLEMADLIVAETTCDGKKKMYERMARHKEMVVLELPQKPGEPHALEHWLGELRRFRGFLEARFGRPITDADLRDAIGTMNRERTLRRALAEMNRQTPPAWTGRQLLQFKSIISGIDEDLAAYHTLANEGPAGDKPKPSAVRVLLTGVPTVHEAEKVIDLIEQSGGTIVCMENCTGLKPLLEDVDADAPDPLEAIARKYLHLPCSVMTPNNPRIDLLSRLAAEYQADCIIDLVWQGCLTYDVESALVKEAAVKLRIPCLKITTDYAPADAPRLAVRIEALMETAARSNA